MFCSNCGKEISVDAKFCAHCGSKIQTTIEPDKPKMEQEIIIKEGLCNRVKSKFFVENGHAMLTNKRFIYSKHSFAKIAAIGLFVNLTKGSYDFDIPVDDILCLKEGRQGFSKTIIICTKSGEEFNFYFTDKQRWEIELTNVIKSNS